MRISDWSSDVCSSDLTLPLPQLALRLKQQHAGQVAILVDLSAIPAIHSRILFRSMARFIEEHTADQPIDAVPLARTSLFTLSPPEAAQRLRSRLGPRSAHLSGRRHGHRKRVVSGRGGDV